ncbi:MAG: hypothetical protein COS72_03645 [Candidatus Moranbacteria bacterium CG06_land_8_20_14_3_00_43_56]|nr:MAG: hypothetical protein COS72_03645 [Candidatus Moranbacteria bacterium CG06_land_8_20_14_3_00_43_56]PIV83600.1 MAG: hypothetical protein COW51_03860 [Candidatus Moranbacteria bacterium CG17_big_fil_post_rev_8_21_14_2_50_44_12]PIW93091.1 MAG: hypothetical protein COZ87_03180 [Candidatus Moranbacteria bacterium CG_4_8_14_3_um_filter_43_15]PJA85988.1 MAG: hypothetical protein CO142_02355 [Candidatus Moranbacteria bacterium CG_4_9_14_3_um_filter_44_28]
MPQYKKKMFQKAGFTLIELLITIFLVSVGLVGVLAFFNASLQSNSEAKNELIAAGLAQEEVDLVRNIVDHNYLNGSDPWYYELSKSDASDTSWCTGVDREIFFGDGFKCHSKAKAAVVCFYKNDGYYYQKNSNCPSGTSYETGFSRSLSISGYDANNSGGAINLDDKDCLKVTATVTWNSRTTQAQDIICEPRQ